MSLVTPDRSESSPVAVNEQREGPAPGSAKSPKKSSNCLFSSFSRLGIKDEAASPAATDLLPSFETQRPDLLQAVADMPSESNRQLSPKSPAAEQNQGPAVAQPLLSSPLPLPLPLPCADHSPLQRGSWVPAALPYGLSPFGQSPASAAAAAPSPSGNSPCGFSVGTIPASYPRKKRNCASSSTAHSLSYQPTVIYETIKGTSALLHLQAITAMPAYSNMSFEELRWKEYQLKAQRCPFVFESPSQSCPESKDTPSAAAADHLLQALSDMSARLDLNFQELSTMHSQHNQKPLPSSPTEQRKSLASSLTMPSSSEGPLTKPLPCVDPVAHGITLSWLSRQPSRSSPFLNGTEGFEDTCRRMYGFNAGTPPAKPAARGRSASSTPFSAHSLSYQPTVIYETIKGASALLHLQAITAMPAYSNMSFEELRWKEYQRRPQRSQEQLLQQRSVQVGDFPSPTIGSPFSYQKTDAVGSPSLPYDLASFRAAAAANSRLGAASTADQSTEDGGRRPATD